MKHTALIVLLFSCTLAFAASNSADFPINVHVTTSRLLNYGSGSNLNVFQELDVIIDGKKYELQGDALYATRTAWGLIARGDYKARLINDVHRTDYLSHQTYELIFSDGRTLKFDVIAQIE
jgi:hypothetical protein